MDGMKTTFFKNKNGTISSMRTTMKNPMGSTSYTYGANSAFKGSTMKFGNTTTRISSSGATVGHGYKFGKQTTYTNGVGKKTASLKPF